MTPLEERLTADLAEARAEIARLTAQITRLTELLAEQTAHLGQLAAAAPKKPTITIAALFDKLETVRKTARSWKVVELRLRPLVRRLGELHAVDLTPLVWSEHRAARAEEAWRTDEDGTAHFPSVRTLNQELSWAKYLLYFAVRGKLLERNPLEGTRSEKCRRGRETFLDEADFARLLAALNPLMTAFTLTCMDLGLRFNECRKLQRDWIRPDGGVTLPATITKTGRSRTVFLTQRARQALDRIPEIDGCPHFFANVRRRRGESLPRPALISEQQMRRWFREACLACEIDSRAAPGDLRIRPHDLRHSAASAALRRGASIAAVQRFLGHTSITHTQRYLHTDEAEIANIARLMETGAATEGSAV